jgi:hexosaminidase
MYYLFPKMFSLSERAWNAKPDWSDKTGDQRLSEYNNDWSNFLKILADSELKLLAGEKINFRVAPPGGVIENGEVNILAMYPHQKILYTSDGSDPIRNGLEYKNPVAAETGIIRVVAQDPYSGKFSNEMIISN